MSTPNRYGPWASSIEAGGNPQLSSFWHRRLGMLTATWASRPVLTKTNALMILAAAAVLWTLPTLRPDVDLARAAEPPIPAVAATKNDNTKSERELLEQFNKLYSLKEGEVWKHLGRPFVPGRAIYVRSKHPPLSSDGSRQPERLVFYWEKGKLRNRGLCVDDDSGLIFPLACLVDIGTQDIEGDVNVLRSDRLAGDWVYRVGATRRQTVADLERVLNDDCRLGVRLSMRDVKRKVHVVGGTFSFRESKDASGKHGIHVFGKQSDDTTMIAHQTAGDVDGFIKDLGTLLHMRIVGHQPGLQRQVVEWYYFVPKKSAKTAARPDVASVLKHVSEQTGLTFTEEERTVPVLFVERKK